MFKSPEKKNLDTVPCGKLTWNLPNVHLEKGNASTNHQFWMVFLVVERLEDSANEDGVGAKKNLELTAVVILDHHYPILSSNCSRL